MKKQLLLKSALIAVLLPVGTAALRLIFYYSSLSNILINLKNAPSSEAFPIFAQSIAAAYILFSFSVRNTKTSLVLCITACVAAFLLSPIYALMLLPVAFGFLVINSKAFSLSKRKDAYILTALFAAGIFTAGALLASKTFNRDISALDFAVLFFTDVRIYAISTLAASAVLTVVFAVILKKLSFPYAQKAKSLIRTVMLLSVLTAAVSCAVTTINISDKEYFTAMGYIVMLLCLLKRSDFINAANRDN